MVECLADKISSFSTTFDTDKTLFNETSLVVTLRNPFYSLDVGASSLCLLGHPHLHAILVLFLHQCHPRPTIRANERRNLTLQAN